MRGCGSCRLSFLSPFRGPELRGEYPGYHLYSDLGQRRWNLLALRMVLFREGEEFGISTQTLHVVLNNQY